METTIAHHVHDALAQVEQLQDRIVEKRVFRGYSGVARMVCGAAAIGAAAILASPAYPANPMAHLAGWLGVLALGVVLNYGYLAWWFLFDPEVRRNPRRLKPAVDALPALAVGAALTLALLVRGEFDLLFGVWMCLYGLAQVAYRNSLPKPIYLVGIGYILCGAAYLVCFELPFRNPWPMGIVFFAGEWAGGVTLYLNERRACARQTSDEEQTP